MRPNPARDAETAHRRWLAIKADPVRHAAYVARRRRRGEPVACKGCGQMFRPEVRHRRPGRYCSLDCYRHHRPRGIGLSCRVWFVTCDNCSTLFAARRPNRKRCSKECDQAHINDSQRVKSREYQRRTRYTAIRYWAIDSSPEAIALATTYYELRQQLRALRHA